jgi:hypothetical protein
MSLRDHYLRREAALPPDTAKTRLTIITMGTSAPKIARAP